MCKGSGTGVCLSYSKNRKETLSLYSSRQEETGGRWNERATHGRYHSALVDRVRVWAFTLSEVGSCWRVINRGLTSFLIHFININSSCYMTNTLKGARAKSGKTGWYWNFQAGNKGGEGQTGSCGRRRGWVLDIFWRKCWGICREIGSELWDKEERMSKFLIWASRRMELPLAAMRKTVGRAGLGRKIRNLA